MQICPTNKHGETVVQCQGCHPKFLTLGSHHKGQVPTDTAFVKLSQWLQCWR